MYGAHGAEALRKLRAHEWFEVLIVDPGLVLRLDDFLAFVTAEKLTDPWSARERYAAKLGKKRVYASPLHRRNGTAPPRLRPPTPAWADLYAISKLSLLSA